MLDILMPVCRDRRNCGYFLFIFVKQLSAAVVACVILLVSFGFTCGGLFFHFVIRVVFGRNHRYFGNGLFVLVKQPVAAIARVVQFVACLSTSRLFRCNFLVGVFSLGNRWN